MAQIHGNLVFIAGTWYRAQAIRPNETGGTKNTCIFVGISWFELHEISVSELKVEELIRHEQEIKEILEQCKEG